MKVRLIILFIMICHFSNAQSIEDNLNKYWHYRDRLEENFMIVGSPELQGTNWPANVIYFIEDKRMDYGENPTHDFSMYLCVLATEYRLLKDYAQDSKADETLQKIAWALQSFDRVDLNTEKFFRARISNPPLQDNDDNFWQKIDNYINPSEDLNGFFLRGDIDGYLDPANHWSYRNTDSTYRVNPESDILSYNNNQLKKGTTVKIQSVGCLFNSRGKVEANNRTVMSQDEVWALLIGLAFINKFVDDTKTFIDLEGHSITVKKWAKNITHRVVEFMGSFDFPYWKIFIPVPDDTHSYQVIEDENGGNVWASYLFAKAGNEICGNEYSNLQNIRSLNTKPFVDTYLGYDQMTFNLTHGKSSIPFGILNLALISGKKTFSYYYNLFLYTTAYFAIFSNERLPLTYSLLHDIDIKDKLENEQYNTFKNTCLHILNQASECGPWLKCTGNFTGLISNKYWWCGRWSDSQNNIIFDPDIPFKRYPEGCWHNNFGNGLDYMLMHNLYWLAFMTPPVKSNITLDFPFSGIGTNSYPYVLNTDFIEASNNINSGGNVRYEASFVRLKQNFRVYPDATFRAVNSGESLSSPIYAYKYYRPSCACFFDIQPNKRNDSIKTDTVYLKNESVGSEHSSEPENAEINKSGVEECIISPNPFKDRFFIIFGSEISDEDLSIYIYGIDGKIVLEKHDVLQYEKIDTGNLKSGMYILKIQKSNDILTYKIIKL